MLPVLLQHTNLKQTTNTKRQKKSFYENYHRVFPKVLHRNNTTFPKMSKQSLHLNIYFILILLSIFAPVASSFVAQHSTRLTTAGLKQENRPFSISKPLFLHVEPIHLHRDTIVRLDDPVEENTPQLSPKEVNDRNLHRFTNHIAPWMLALYFIGHLMNNYLAAVPGVDESGNVAVDPAFGGSLLIGVGMLMIKWTIDKVQMLD